MIERLVQYLNAKESLIQNCKSQNKLHNQKWVSQIQLIMVRYPKGISLKLNYNNESMQLLIL